MDTPENADPTGELLRVDPLPTCSDFWGCVAASVDSITKALPELYQSDGYARIELTKQLDRLVDIMERAAHPMMKIDGQNEKSDPR